MIGPPGIPVRSGTTHRHRLDRGGNRQINATIHRIAVVLHGDLHHENVLRSTSGWVAIDPSAYWLACAELLA
jgi:hypothetical protein